MKIQIKSLAGMLMAWAFLAPSNVLAAEAPPVKITRVEIAGGETLFVEPTPPGDGAGAGTYPGTNLRHTQCVGTRGKGIIFDVNSTWSRQEYNRVMGEIVDATPQAFSEHIRPCVMKKITWREFYVDPSIAPSNRAQARDPNWSNYRWNEDDTLGDLLADPIFAAENAMLAVLIADQSSAQNNSPPAWYINLGYTFGDVSLRRYHNRLDIPAAVDHLADFYIAWLKRYANAENLHSLALGEYFPQDTNFFPEDFDLNKFYQGRLDLWKEILANVPLDQDGNQLAIYQTNPMLRGGVTIADMEALNMGVSYSDIFLFKDGCGAADGSQSCENESYSWIAQEAHGTLPIMLIGDDSKVRKGRSYTWSGLANPFDLQNGDRSPPTPQQLFWYHGEKGVLPFDNLFLTIEGNFPQTKESLAEAVEMFGTSGTHSERWGVSPPKTPGT